MYYVRHVDSLILSFIRLYKEVIKICSKVINTFKELLLKINSDKFNICYSNFKNKNTLVLYVFLIKNELIKKKMVKTLMLQSSSKQF